MKKNHSIRILVGAMAMASILTVGAVAQEALPVQTNPAVTDQESDEIVTKYLLTSGKIASVEQNDDGGYTVSIENDDMGLICHVSGAVFVLDQKDGSYKSLEDLKEGMEVTVVRESMSPTTMSIPPQTPGAVGFVMHAEPGSIAIGQFDEELVNAENTLKLNIGEDTKIVDIRGTKMVYQAEDLKNSELLVLYTVTTRSIPAQTTPELVMILNNAELEAEAGVEAETENTEARETPSMTALREMAESAGYNVVWTANDEPIMLAKTGSAVMLNIGSAEVSVNGETKTLPQAVELVGDVTMVSAELQQLL